MSTTSAQHCTLGAGRKRMSSENHERRSPPANRPKTQKGNSTLLSHIHTHTRTHTHTRPHTHTHTLTGSQPWTQRECPTCGESCHIRYKSCPHCEQQFPSSSKETGNRTIAYDLGTHTRTHTHTPTHAHTHAHTQTYTHTHTHICCLLLVVPTWFRFS